MKTFVVFPDEQHGFNIREMTIIARDDAGPRSKVVVGIDRHERDGATKGVLKENWIGIRIVNADRCFETAADAYDQMYADCLEEANKWMKRAIYNKVEP